MSSRSVFLTTTTTTTTAATDPQRTDTHSGKQQLGSARVKGGEHRQTPGSREIVVVLQQKMADDPEYDGSEPPTSFYEFIALRKTDGPESSSRSSSRSSSSSTGTAASTGPSSSSSSSSRSRSRSSSTSKSTKTDFHYATLYPPRPFGSHMAFGGSVLVAALQAGFCALQEAAGSTAGGAEEYVAYSFQGSFTAPSSLERHLDVHVRLFRVTRTFATCAVRVTQPDAKGKTRTNMVATLDFIRPLPSLLEFSAPPRDPVSGQNWAGPEKLRSYYDEIEQRAEEGVRSPAAIAIERLAVADWLAILEVRMPPESYAAQTCGCLVPTLPTCQDHLHPTHKRAADWSRYTTPLDAGGIAADRYAQRGLGITPTTANFAALAHLADTRLAWVPSATNKVSIRRIEFTATLEFSLRFFQREFRADEWMLREMRSLAAGEGRSFGESRFWDRGGRLLATMTQQCLLRPRKLDEDDADLAKALDAKL